MHQLDVCSFIKTFTATTPRSTLHSNIILLPCPLFISLDVKKPGKKTRGKSSSILQYVFGFVVKTMNIWRFFVFAGPLAVPKTIYGTSCSLLGKLSDPKTRLPLWLFLRAPYSILVSSPENLPIFYSSTKFCKKLSGSKYCVHILRNFRAFGYFSFSQPRQSEIYDV